MSTALSRCRSCDSSIIWTETQSGKRMPVDAEPDEAGRFVLESNDLGYGAGEAPIAIYVGENIVNGEKYQSHFATCPHAADWRKKGGL